MTQRSQSQGWALDIALALGGFDALHPEAKATMEQLGHDHTDFDKVFSQVKSGAMIPKAWATVAAQAQERAKHYEQKDLQLLPVICISELLLCGDVHNIHILMMIHES